jgi:hypothetical protein
VRADLLGATRWGMRWSAASESFEAYVVPEVCVVGLTGFEVGLEIVPLVVSPLRRRGGAIQKSWAQLLMAPEAGGGVGGWCGWVGGQAGVCDEGRRSVWSASRFLRWGVGDGCVELCKGSSTKRRAE